MCAALTAELALLIEPLDLLQEQTHTATAEACQGAVRHAAAALSGCEADIR